MNKLWTVLVLLALFIFAGGCHLQNEEKSASDTWLRRMCCDFSGKIYLSNVEINATSINITFCASTIERLSLSLTNKENPGCEIKVDTMLGLLDANLSLGYVNLFKKETSAFFKGEKFRDGNYFLQLTTENGCGALRFRLLNGELIPVKRICIENCVGNSY